jgi:Zn-dependent alcohol dehydrogenase
VQGLLSRRYPLEQINQALDDLEAGRVARPLIDMSEA